MMRLLCARRALLLVLLLHCSPGELHVFVILIGDLRIHYIVACNVMIGLIFESLEQASGLHCEFLCFCFILFKYSSFSEILLDVEKGFNDVGIFIEVFRLK